MLATISVVLELLMSWLPNIQLTFFLFILYATTMGFRRSSLIIILHTTVDSLLMGFQVFYYIPMLVGYLLIPTVLFFVRTKKPMVLALLSVLFSLIYSWLFVLATMLVTATPAWEYFLADIPFEILLACTSFISTLWLYKPVSKHFLYLKENF